MRISRLRRRGVPALALLVLAGGALPAQDCSFTCDELIGVSHWYYNLWPLTDYQVRCEGHWSSYTICGGYSSSKRDVARFSNTSVGTPHALQNAGVVYLTYGHHSWGDNKDRVYLGTSYDGRSFSHRLLVDNWQVCPFGSPCEGAWAPELIIRDDGVWLLYFTGRHNSNQIPRTFVATSYDGGWTWNFNWQWDPYRPWQYKGVFDDQEATYRFGTFASQPDGTLLAYATSNSNNLIYKFTSSGTGQNAGLVWTKVTSLGYWGIAPGDVKYDAVNGYYVWTLDPPTIISNDCDVPTWKYPAIALSFDGNFFSYPGVENYFNGTIVVSAEAAPLGNRKGVIQYGAPLLVYMNDQESATYNHPTTNTLFVMDWRRGSGRGCAYP